jgi:hypothetical protein
MEQFFPLLIAFISGVVIATIVIRWAVYQALDHFIMNMGLNDAQSEEPVSIRMRIELVDNQVLCYNVDTHEFICQGHTLDEVIEHFKQRFPDCDGVLEPDDSNPESREWIQEQMKK